MTMQQQIKRTIIEIHLISLRARKAKCQRFSMNNDMLREADILQSQIQALEDEFVAVGRKG